MTFTAQQSDEERKAKKREYDKLYYQKNREKRCAYNKKYAEEHREELYAKDKARGRKRHREWRDKQPKEKLKARDRAYHLKVKYGITVEEFNVVLADQAGRCAICSSDNSSSSRHWHVDHCHASGKVRGILCHHCNTALGLMRDNPATLLAAVDYLRKHNGEAANIV